MPMPVIPLDSMFNELALLLFTAIVAAIVAARLRQPLIIAFIIMGILVGPVGLNVIRSTEQLGVLAEMGLALLLFVVGLKLDPNVIRSMGSVALATGLGKIAFTGVIGFALALSLKMTMITALYVAAALVFSSTILIVKLLSDKRETDSLYGRIALGFLIVEDVVVVLVMMGLSAFTITPTINPALQMLLIVLKGLGLLFGVWAVSRFIFPRILPSMARSTELLLLFGIAWALVLAAISEGMGFNREVGAFIAGLSLASTMYRDLLSAKLTSIRDFLLLFFFLELGSHLDLHNLGAQIITAIPLTLLVIVGKPLVVMGILGRMGYSKRTGFMAGLASAQISEFSLILMAMGVSAGHVGNEALGLVTLVLIVSMGIDIHLVMHAQPLYKRLSSYLRIFERKGLHKEAAGDSAMEMQGDGIILVGLGRYGSSINTELLNRGRVTLGVDFDPQAVREWKAKGENAIFGDAEDPDFSHALPLSSARWVVSSIRDAEINAGIFQTLRHEGYKGYFACATFDASGPSLEVLRQHADIMFNPYEDAATQAADLILEREDQIARGKMDRIIESMSGHYIICGYGRMGQQIAKDLSFYNVPCVVVEWNPEQLPRLREQNMLHIEGKATEDPVLIKAGIKRAKGLISVAATDEENVFITLTAKVLNPNLIIVARSILMENEDKLRHAGADWVMSPYIYGGHRMAAAVIKPEVMEFLDLVVHSEGLETDMAKIVVQPGSSCVGKTLREIDLWENCEVTQLAVRRHGERLHANPSPTFAILEGDELIVMGTPPQIKAAQQMLSNPKLVKG
jgi:Kef-type K+ transport system membrane component KefB/Trk K+ transport system NAD-binding subunit